MLKDQGFHSVVEDWLALTRSVEREYHSCHLAKAEDLCWEALGRAKLLGEFEPRLGISLSNLAVLQRCRGIRDKAEDLSNLALRIFQALDQRSPLMAKGLLNAACFFHDDGRWSEARRLYSRAINLLEEGNREDLLCQALTLLARLNTDQGKPAQGETLLKRVQSLEPDSTEVYLLFCLTSVQLALRQDRLQRAEMVLKQADELFGLEVRVQGLWRSSWEALAGDLEVSLFKAARKVSLVPSAEAEGRKSTAIAHYLKALELRNAHLGGFHSGCGDLHCRLASFYVDLQDSTTAEGHLRKALTILLSSRGPYHWETLKCLELSQQVLRLTNHHREADEMESRIRHVERRVRDKARETYVVWGDLDS